MKHLSPLLRLIYLLYSHVFVVFLVSCNDEPTQQPTPTPKPPHKQQDTTLHDVDWSITTFGKGGLSSSYFKDVFAISDSDVWAVGVIYSANTHTYDSLGQWIDPCNAADWDGKEWKLFSFKITHWGGNSSFTDLRAVYAWGSKDVWFFSLGSYLHWDGVSFTSAYIAEGTRGGIEKVWGRSSNDFYLVGTNGSITHYDGKRFYLIESGTDIDLEDVYGSKDGKIWTGGYQYSDGRRIFLKIQDGITSKIEIYPYITYGENIWVSTDTLYADTGAGMFIQSTTDSLQWRFLPWKSIAYPLGRIWGMRGIADNNVFAVGDYGTIIHYNGKS